MAGIVSITGLSASEPAGQRTLGPLSVQGTAVVGDTQTVSLGAGDNVIPVPLGTIGVVVVPPSTGSAVLKYRTNLNSTDGGLPISASQPFVHVFPSSPSTTALYLNASGAQSALVSFWMW